MTTQVHKSSTSAGAFAALAAACVFALQLLVSGLALGATHASFSDSIICAQTQQGDRAGGAPAAPATRHHVGCCILHHAAFDAPPERSANVVVFDLPATRADSAPAVSIDALKTAPELAALSARAPPVSRA